MKMTEIRVLKEDDLRVQIANLKRELFDMRFKGAVEQIAQPSRLREVRRDIARMHTVMRERTKPGKAAS